MRGSYIDAKDANGKVQHWQCETGAPNELVRRGWKRHDLKVGDDVSVKGFPRQGKPGYRAMCGGEIVFPDGRKVFQRIKPTASPRNRSKLCYFGILFLIRPSLTSLLFSAQTYSP